MDSILLIDILLAACTVMLNILWILYQCHTFTWLGQHGKSVTTLVTQVDSAKSEHTFVTAKWTDPRTGRAYVFEGLNTASPLREGALVTVLIDPRHTQRYLRDQLGSSSRAYPLA